MSREGSLATEVSDTAELNMGSLGGLWEVHIL